MFRKILFGFITVCSLGNMNIVWGQDTMIDEIVAVVGSNIILKSDIEEMYQNNQIEGISGDSDARCKILESLLEEKLLLTEADLDTTIIVTDSQVNQSLDQQMNFLIQNLGSEEAVERYFNKPISEIKSGYQEMITNNIKTSQMQGNITGDVTTSPSEVRYFYRSLKEEEIPLISPQVEYSEIVVKPLISIEQTNEIKSRLRDLKRRIENGENFATLAILYSEDGSSSNGGEIGYMGRGQLVPEYATAAFNLKGDKVSNVIESEYGFHIIQLIDQKGDKVNSRHILIKPKPSAEALAGSASRLDSISDIIRKGQISFEDAALRFSEEKDTRFGGGVAINQNTLSSKWELSELNPDVSKVLDKMKINEISDPFKTTDSKGQIVYKIVKLLNRAEEHRASIQEDYQTINELYLQKKQNDTLNKWISEKLEKTYIHINDSYANCNFEFKGWIK